MENLYEIGIPYWDSNPESPLDDVTLPGGFTYALPIGDIVGSGALLPMVRQVELICYQGLPCSLPWPSETALSQSLNRLWAMSLAASSLRTSSRHL